MEKLKWGIIHFEEGPLHQDGGLAYRAKVPGGWLYRYHGNDGVALTYVPDPTQWQEFAWTVISALRYDGTGIPVAPSVADALNSAGTKP